MALTFGSKITAEDFNNLKAKVKAEMLRRKYTGSVAAYGTDYSDVPTQKGKIKAIHIQEIVNPLNQVNDTNYTNTATKSKIMAMQSLEVFVTTLASKNINTSNTAETGCRSSCTGLCATGCEETCRSCSNNCADGCSGSCGSSCNKGCADGCTGSCGTSCNKACANNCSGGCGGTCKGKCKGTCTTNCAPTCANGPGWN